MLSNLLWPLCVFRELRDLNWVNNRPNSSLFHPQAADLTGVGARSPQIAVCLMVERYYSGIRDQRGTTPWDFFLPSTLVSPLLPDLLASLFSSSSYCCSFFSQPSPFFFSFLSSFPYPFPFSPPYILRILTESTARTRRHTRLFSSVSILISRARNSRTLRSLGVLKRNASISRVFAAHPTRPLPPWRPVARPTLAAFISAAMKETRLRHFFFFF